MEKKLTEIVILTESGGDIPKDIEKEYGIVVLPMHVIMSGKDYEDGSFPIEQIGEYYKQTGNIPTTSATNIGQYMEAYDDIHNKYPNKIILHLCYSAITTATYQNSIAASENRDYVIHIDTKAVSGGQAFIVYRVAQYIRENPDDSIANLEKYISELITKVHMSFIPGNLDFLKAGGRVSNVAYLGANILGLKPVIDIVDGKLIGTRKFRGRDFERLCKKLVKENTEKFSPDYSELFLISNYGLSEETLDNISAYSESLGFKKIRWLKAGGVITTHSGPGCFGVVFSE